MKNTQNISLIVHFSVLPDPRREHQNTKRHELIDIIVIAVLAVMCGADTWVDIATFGRKKEQWLKKFLELPNGIPSHDTFGRVFSLLDPQQLARVLRQFVQAVLGSLEGQTIAIDG